MIPVTRLNGKKFVVNASQIRFVESTPDTMITLNSGDKIMVAETMDQIVHLVVQYERQIRIFEPPAKAR
ncbi:MAG: flagellar FlbD family protein [Phycisphaerae bacterium]|nr:flagellar FlbD family protein [Phycisphaerae bacterium]